MLSISISEILVSIVLIFIISIPGICLYARIRPDESKLGVFFFGVIVGLALLCFGLALSKVTQIFLVRWIPSAIAVSPLLTRRHQKKRPLLPIKMQLWVLVGPTVATIGLLTSIYRYMPQVRIPRTGYWALDTDIQFLLSLASESIHRSPRVFPSSSVSEIGYTWLFPGLVGIFSDLSNISISEILLILWPIFFSIFFTFLLSLLTFKISHSGFAAAMTPIACVFLSGPLLVPGIQWIFGESIMMNSPHRDFAELLLITFVYLLYTDTNRQQTCFLKTTEAIIFFLIVFTAVGSKGSMLILLGGGLAVLVALKFFSNFKLKFHLRNIFSALSGCIAAQLIVVGFHGSNASPKFQFPRFLKQFGTSQPTLAIFLFILVYVLWILVPLPINPQNKIPIVATLYMKSFLVIALLGALFLNVHGLSQFYLIHSTKPFLLMFMVIAIVHQLSEFNRWFNFVFLLAVLAFWFAGLLINSQTNEFPTLILRLVFLLIPYVLISTYFFLNIVFNWTREKNSVINYLKSALLIPFAYQVLAFPNAGIISAVNSLQAGEVTAEVFAAGAISNDQIDSLIWLRSNTRINDLVATNLACERDEHTLYSQYEQGLIPSECDRRWFILSAISERRFLIESLAYTGNDYLNKLKLIAVSNSFISSPSESNKAKLLTLGVKYIFIDRRNPYDSDINQFCDVIRKTEWSILCTIKIV